MKIHLQAATRLQATTKVLEILQYLKYAVDKARRQMDEDRAQGVIQQAKDQARKDLKAEGLNDAAIQQFLIRYAG